MYYKIGVFELLRFKSSFSADELVKRWDEFTSPARFAGNDDMMDLIFISKRNDKNVKLVRRTRSKRDPFSCMFRGKIVSNDNGSEIRGFFTKAIFDYIAVILLIELFFYIRYLVIDRGDSPATVNVLLACAIIGGALLLYNTRSAKRRFSEFISRIADTENDKYLSRKELKEKED